MHSKIVQIHIMKHLLTYQIYIPKTGQQSGIKISTPIMIACIKLINHPGSYINDDHTHVINIQGKH